jgi:hypothetical protein
MVDQLLYAMIDLPINYLKKTIRVTFIEEYGIDEGGLLRYETDLLIDQRVVSYRRKRTKGPRGSVLLHSKWLLDY